MYVEKKLLLILQRLFGILRHCCGSNDHPDIRLFMKVIRLIMVYSLVKPPKGCNVSASDTMETLIKRKPEESKVTDERIQWDNKLKNVLTSKKESGNEDEYDYETDHDYDVAMTSKEAQAYYSGVIARSAERFTRCSTCLDSLRNETPQERDKAIVCLTHGFLYYASDALFQLTTEIERALLKVIGLHSLNEDTLIQALDKLARANLPRVGCSQHKQDLSIKLVNYYFISRANQVAKCYNKIYDDKKHKTKKMRKNAKL